MHRLLAAPAEYAEEFRDGLGVRYLRPGKAAAAVHVLRLSRDLAAARAAVLDRVDRLSTLRLGPYPPLRSAGAPPDDSFALEIVSDHVPGVRLIEMLELAGAGRLTIDPEAALHIVRQVLGALASLHESRKVSHGAIGPERLVVTPRGQIMVTDYVLGLALEQIGYPPARLWMEMRVPVPPGRAEARFDEQTDVLQVGVLALALLAGRPLDVDDYPDRMTSLVDSLGWRAGRDGQTPLIDAVGDWLRSVLQLGTRRRPPSARQAQTRLEAIVSKWRPAGAPANPLKALLGDYHRGRGAGLDARRTPIEGTESAALAGARSANAPYRADEAVEEPAVARRQTLTLLPDTPPRPSGECPVEALVGDPQRKGAGVCWRPGLPAPAHMPALKGRPPEPLPRSQPGSLSRPLRPQAAAEPTRDPHAQSWEPASFDAAQDKLAERALPARQTIEPELRVRRRPSLVIVPEVPEPVPEDAPQTLAPTAPPAAPTICPVAPDPVEAVVCDPHQSSWEPALAGSSPKLADLSRAQSREASFRDQALRDPLPVPPGRKDAALATGARAFVGGAMVLVARAFRAAGPVAGRMIAAVAAAVLHVVRVTGRYSTHAATASLRAASVFMHAALAFLRIARRALALLVTSGTAGLRLAVRVSRAARTAVARGLRAGASASIRVASIGGRLALAGARVVAVRGLQALAARSRGVRAACRWVLHLAVVLAPLVGRFGRAGAAVCVRAASWGLRLTRRGARVSARAAIVAGSRAVALTRRGLGVGADTVSRLRDAHVGRPVVIVTLILACAWPGVRLARAWWPVIQQRFDASRESPEPRALEERAPTATGSLRIRSEPSGAEVWLEGKLAGRTPLTVDAVRPGKRSILLTGPAGSARAEVHVRPGEAADVIVPIYSGWIAVFAPIELRIIERGRLVGTTADGRILISPGEHVLDLVSEQYGFSIRRTAVVKPGDVTALNVELPPVPLEISAPAGSEVWLDGRLLGTAPLERQSAPPGTSVIVMRHPTLGERRQTATLTYRQTPNRAVF